MAPVFISFKWKIIWLTALPLVAAFAGIIYTNQSAMQQQFQLQRDRLHVQRQHKIDKQLTGLQEILYLKTQHLLDQPSIIHALKTGNKNQLKKVFNKQWLPLRINQHFSSVVFYTREHELLGQWGEPYIHQHQVEDSNIHNQKGWYSHCDSSCQVFILIPLGKAGTALAGYTANVISEKLASETNTAMALLASSQSLAQPALLDIPNNNFRLLAATDKALLQQSLNNAQQQSLTSNKQFIQLGKQHIELKTYTMKNLHNQQSVFLISADNITPDINILLRHQFNDLLYAGAGLTIMLVFLSLQLGETSSRVNRLNSLIRRLGIGKKGALPLLSKYEHHHWINDEIDEIQKSLVDCNNQKKEKIQDNIFQIKPNNIKP